MHHSMDQGLGGYMNGFLNMGMGAWALISVLVVVVIVFAMAKKRPK